MRKFVIRIVLVASALVVLAAQTAQAQVAVNVTIGGFYDELTPYGRWVDCSYGQCWVPRQVAADWQPYSNGHWIYTEYGWTWVSDDPWGGSPYHYGTWTSIEGYGWSWVPGTVWAPAWVTWNYGNDYVGWAPLPPTIILGASGYSGRPVVVSHTHYVFVPTNRFVDRNVMSVRVPARQSEALFRQTKPLTGFAVSGGIVRNTALPMQGIERAAGGRIETRTIQSAGTAPRPMSAGNGRLSVVAPAREVKAAAAARPHAASRSTENPREEKPAHGAQTREVKAPSASKPKGAAPSSEPGHGERPPADRESHGGKDSTSPKASKAEHPPKAHDAPPAASHRDPAQKPPEHRPEPPRQAQPSRPAEHAPKPNPHSEKPRPVEKDKKPEGGSH